MNGVSFDLKKPNLKVLVIGNSYMYNATNLLPLIAKSSGADLSDMCIYKIERADASFKSWYDVHNNDDRGQYTITKVLGDISVNIKLGTGDSFDGTLWE